MLKQKNEAVLHEETMQNKLGHLVPISLVPEIDKDREKLIDELFSEAIEVQQQMVKFKTRAMGDVDAFVELAAEKYDASLGGKKGNITLLNFNNTKKISIQISERFHFDERIHAAKALIDECIEEWSADSNDKIKALIEHAFHTDKEGKVNTGAVLSLMRLDIADDKWHKAMKALKDSMEVLGSTPYVRLYHRQTINGEWKAISLDMAKL